MTEQQSVRRKAYLALAAVTILWGYNWVIMKESLQYCDPFVFTAMRIFAGSFILLLILAWKRRSIMPHNIPLLILTGILSTTGGTAVAMWALTSGEAGKTAILVYTMPFWALLLGWPILSERIRGLHWLAAGFALSGLMLILAPWKISLDIAGSLLAIAAGLMWAAGSILIKIMAKKSDFDLLSVTAWQLFFGAIPIGVLVVLIPDPLVSWTPYLLGALTYNIVFATAIAVLLWFYALQKLPAGSATMGTLATPVIGAVAAAVQLGERPSVTDMAGMILILCGIVLLTFLDLRRNRETGN
jgi:drug/metabolite transporter (DMT)-like permease